ncbi:putative transcription factor interactor and regulator CCHC(Zn) family [Helianthus anomalus]
MKHIDPTDLEEMNILHQVAILSLRENNISKRTGRKYLGLKGRSRVGLDKSKIKCFKCNRLGHLARECRCQTSNTTLVITYPNQRPQFSNHKYFYQNSQNTQNTLAANVQNTAHFAQALSYVPMQYVQTPVP